MGGKDRGDVFCFYSTNCETLTLAEAAINQLRDAVAPEFVIDDVQKEVYDDEVIVFVTAVCRDFIYEAASSNIPDDRTWGLPEDDEERRLWVDGMIATPEGWDLDEVRFSY